MASLLRQFILALQFLTIVPVRIKGELREREMLGSAVFYPMVGLLLGVMSACVDFMSGLVFSDGLSLVLVLLSLELATGGLHLDGLSDTVDALGSKADRDERLLIMHKGPAGPLGVAAIIFTLLLKYTALLQIGNMTYFDRYAALLYMPLAGRWAMLLGMYLGKPARADGLGSIFIGRIGHVRVIAATLLALTVLAGPAFLLRSYAPSGWPVFSVCVLVVLLMYTLLVRTIAAKRLGGFTGDVLGALGETSEGLYLLTLIIWSRLYTL